MRISFSSLTRSLVCLLAWCPVASAQRNQIQAEPYAIQGVRMDLAEDAPMHTLLLRAGRIEAVLPLDVEVQSEYRVLDATGLIALPAFVDAYSQAGLTMPEPWVDQDEPLDTERDVRIDMRLANRKGIQPHWSALDGWKMDRKGSEERLRRGFAGLLVAPHGELLSGDSLLALMNGSPRREAVLRDRVFAHAAFDAHGEGYPNTLMAYHAQLRQFWMDARWQADIAARRAAGSAAPRLPLDLDLQAALPVLAGTKRLLCEAETARDIYRWLALSEEFGFSLAITGGRDAWQLAPELARRKVPVVLTLNWDEEEPDPDAKDHPKAPGQNDPQQEAKPEPEGSAPSDRESSGSESSDGAKAEDTKKEQAQTVDPWVYTEPKALRVERRREWLAQRDNALRLREAGVELYFGSGSESANRLVERLSVLVDAGFPAGELIQILSENSAQWLGAPQDLGALAPGRAATFCLWSASPFVKKSKVRYAFIEGRLSQWEDKDSDAKEEAKPADESEGATSNLTLAGHWVLHFGSENPDLEVTLHLVVSEERIVRGSWEGSQGGVQMDSQTIAGTVEGEHFSLTSEAVLEGVTVPVQIEGVWQGDTLSGSVRSQNPIVELNLNLQGQRQPQGVR